MRRLRVMLATLNERWNERLDALYNACTQVILEPLPSREESVPIPWDASVSYQPQGDKIRITGTVFGGPDEDSEVVITIRRDRADLAYRLFVDCHDREEFTASAKLLLDMNVDWAEVP